MNFPRTTDPLVFVAVALMLLIVIVWSRRSPPPKEITLSDGTKALEVAGSNGDQWVQTMPDGTHRLTTFTVAYREDGSPDHDYDMREVITPERAAELLGRDRADGRTAATD